MILLEVACVAIVSLYVAVRMVRAGPSNRGEVLRRLLLLLLASWLGEDSVIRAYGFYAYSPSWHLFVDRVPLLIVIIWPIVIDSAWCLAQRLTSSRWVPLLGAAIVLCDAALIEPVAVHANLWTWTEPGLFAVPPIGILGWALFAGAAMVALPRVRVLTLLAAPAATHVLLLACWWGGLRWINQPLPDWSGAAVAWLALAAVAGFGLSRRLGSRVPLPDLLVRVPGAGFFFVLLARDPTLPLVVYALAFAPPYLALLPRGRSSRGGSLLAALVVFLSVAGCASGSKPRRADAWDRIDAPEPYGSPLPPPSGKVFPSERAVTLLEAELDAFSRTSRRARDAVRTGTPMSSTQSENWNRLLQAIDKYLSTGVTRIDSAEVIRARAVIELEMEADAQVYALVPPTLVEQVLERETQLGLRTYRIKRAGEARTQPVAIHRPVSAAAIGSFLWPVSPVHVNSLFGRRFHPIARQYRPHLGIDLEAAVGQAVGAAAGGVVRQVGTNGGHGLQITIEHASGLLTRYSHLSRARVDVGEKVQAKQEIGEAGQTGDATGPHLHFEVVREGVPEDPLDTLPYDPRA